MLLPSLTPISALRLHSAVQTLQPIPSKRHHAQLHISILSDCLLSQSRTLKASFQVNGPVKEEGRQLFLEAVQKTMLTGAAFYLISSHLELMSSLCQSADGAVNKKVEEQTTGGERRANLESFKAQRLQSGREL